MEPRPRGCVAAGAAESERWTPPRADAPRVSRPVSQVLLLLLPGVRVQGSTPGSRCDCTSDIQRRYGPFCCRGCPMGHYLKARCTEHCGDSTCLPCPRGTFLARENHYNAHCTRCQACDEEAFQVALENCSAVADTRCGCAPGWLVDCSVKPCMANSPFRCLQCPDCKSPDRHTPVPCSGRDNSCGPCLPGFYEHSDGCMSCPTSILGSCPEPCAAVCGWRPSSVLGPGACGWPAGPVPTWGHLRLLVLALPVSQAGSSRQSWHRGPDPTSEFPPVAPGQHPCPPCTPWQQWEGLHCPVSRQRLDPWLPPGPGGALSARATVLGPAAQPSSWVSSGTSAVASAPCRLSRRRAPARTATVRRDGRGPCAALEGVRAHAGAARGGDRGSGGGDRPLP
ncbi:PREDICTED: tumor necrosis factor receptor superfamily member 25 isoform X5 [Chinchilla lanigera]|uniref:tumor necrosis factor receptor superfamily member 25 isoform X5 n=1 Tax=Chinchilla lanigera TaxID=34839 RepID=UPI0006969D82|nr:PREDICTED: tumor necrosis factor receptor superfamily member 25 isoform X5 [Chinchilla lanigera]